MRKLAFIQDVFVTAVIVFGVGLLISGNTELFALSIIHR
jgi:hypothetical protein